MKFYLSLKLDQFAATCLTSRYLLYCFRQNEKRGNIGEVNEHETAEILVAAVTDHCNDYDFSTVYSDILGVFRTVPERMKHRHRQM